MYPYVVDTCDYSKYTTYGKTDYLLIITRILEICQSFRAHCVSMTLMTSLTQSPVLLSTHAISRQPGATASSAKVERVSARSFHQQEHPRTGTTSYQGGMITSRRPRLLGRTRSYSCSNVAMRNSVGTSPVWPAVASPTKHPKKPW